MNDQIFTLVLLFSAVFSIILLITLINIIEIVLDKIEPQRLKRFDLNQYKKGVKDSTINIKEK